MKINNSDEFEVEEELTPPQDPETQETILMNGIFNMLMSLCQVRSGYSNWNQAKGEVASWLDTISEELKKDTQEG